jgi:hypothetical protein
LSNNDDSEDIYADPEFDKFLASADISQLESDPVTTAVQSITSISDAALKQPSHESPKTLASCVLEDIWHVKDHLLRLLPQSHSAFKKFRQAFGEAIFVFDKNDQAQIKEFLKKNGQTWDQALRRNPGKIYRRCQRYIPPPDILAPVLKTLFECWRDVPCALDPSNQKLFSAGAWRQVQNALKSAEDGLMSDPPGIPLYFDMGVDKDGLHCYRTVQGTNSVEGNIHMPLQRMFGSLHASPELSDALLCNSRDRRNTTICCKFYLSLTFVSHSLSGWPFQSYWKKMEWSS